MGSADSGRRTLRALSVSPELPIAAESAALNARASSYRSSGEIDSAFAITVSIGGGTSCRYSLQQRRRLR